MFDPHRTRRSDSRYFTRKGQVLQASRVNTNPVIDQKLVPIYKNYILKNGLIPKPEAPPVQPIPIKGISIMFASDNIDNYPFKNMTKSTNPTVNISTMTGSAARYLICFWEDTSGNHKFLTYAQGEQTTITETITNNVICYWRVLPLPSGITVDNYPSYPKGLITDTNDEIVIWLDNKSMTVKPAIPLSI